MYLNHIRVNPEMQSYYDNRTSASRIYHINRKRKGNHTIYFINEEKMIKCNIHLLIRTLSKLSHFDKHDIQKLYSKNYA